MGSDVRHAFPDHLQLDAFGVVNPELEPGVSSTARIDAILDAGSPGEGLIALAQRLQAALGFLPRDGLVRLAQRTGLPLAHIYGVVSFYDSLYLEPRGRYIIRVCEGTACHVAGGPRITAALADRLGVAVGGTTADRRFTLERVACLGCCSLAPVMTINEETHGRLDTRGAVSIVEATGDGKDAHEPGGRRAG